MFQFFRIALHKRRLQKQAERLKCQIVGCDFPISQERWDSWYREAIEEYRRTRPGSIWTYPLEGLSDHPAYQQFVEVENEIRRVICELIPYLCRIRPGLRAAFQLFRKNRYRDFKPSLTSFVGGYICVHEMEDYWLEQARRHLDDARDCPYVREGMCSLEDAAALTLAHQAWLEIGNVESLSDNFKNDIAEIAFRFVQWDALADGWIKECKSNAPLDNGTGGSPSDNSRSVGD